MINLYDIAYGLGLTVAAPVWLLLPKARRKVLRALNQRMGEVAARNGRQQAVWIHAVSLGEVNATRGLVKRLRDLRPDLHLIISTTTDTGYEQARKLYNAPDAAVAALGRPEMLIESTQRPADAQITVIRYPLDFSSAIEKVLDQLRPSLVVLLELEVWPNFIRHCAQRGIPVALVNGRMTELSFKRYRWAAPIISRMMRRLSAVCVQERVYADRFMSLGAPPDRVFITGTMKFDTATVADRVDGDEELAAILRINAASLPTFAARPGASSAAERVWVCGSTGPGEEEIALRVYRRLLSRYARLRLALVPRHPQRFDEVAQLIAAQGFEVRRLSEVKPATRREQILAFLAGEPLPEKNAAPASEVALPPVILGDTMGDLRKFYSLADLVFVGRSLVDLGSRQHGSDMIEPAALGKPVIVGPFTSNFSDAVSRFRAADALMEVHSDQELEEAVGVLLGTPEHALEMGKRAQQVVLQERGATERHVQVILSNLRARGTTRG